MIKKSRQLNLVLLFLAVALLLVISFAIIFVIGTRTSRLADDLLQRQSIVQRLQEIVATAGDAETGQRGYLLTGDEKYLAPYSNALSDVRSRTSVLQKAATEGFIAPQEVEKIDRLVSAKFSELAQTVDLKRQHRDQDALAIVRGGQGKQIMDEIRDTCGQIVAAEEVRINSDLSETIKDGKIRLWLYAGGLVINVLFLGWVCRRIFAEMAARDAATKEIDRQREFLDVTLASIGDGVIVTDAKGRVTFLNEVAQKLCGWSLPDAKGRSCIEIFNIVNETTRALVQNPVDGGRISAASGGHGPGSTFLVTLPKAFRPPPISSDPGSQNTTAGLSALSVLMIEDHEDTALVMVRMLEDMGHKVVPANSVASAIDILTRQKFDLIISDIGLPDGNGVSLIHAVRAFCSAPAIALTGYGMREDVERCLQAGFNRHVTKPVTFEALRQIIAEVLANRNEVINEPAGK
jgi:CHASE3 domain sensor protein/CheY-like chemotaxis protein